MDLRIKAYGNIGKKSRRRAFQEPRHSPKHAFFRDVLWSSDAVYWLERGATEESEELESLRQGYFSASGIYINPLVGKTICKVFSPRDFFVITKLAICLCAKFLFHILFQATKPRGNQSASLASSSDSVPARNIRQDDMTNYEKYIDLQADFYH